MCSDQQPHQHFHPSARDFFTNLDAPMPLPRKLWRLAVNLSRRVTLRQNCCGHEGEPGC